MYNIQDNSRLYYDAVRRVYVRYGISLTRGNHLYDDIIPLSPHD